MRAGAGETPPEKVSGRAHRASPAGDEQRHKPMPVGFRGPLLRSLAEGHRQFGPVGRHRGLFPSPPQYRYCPAKKGDALGVSGPGRLHCGGTDRCPGSTGGCPPRGRVPPPHTHTQGGASGTFRGGNMLLELSPGDRYRADERCCSFPGLARALNTHQVIEVGEEPDRGVGIHLWTSLLPPPSTGSGGSRTPDCCVSVHPSSSSFVVCFCVEPLVFPGF